MKFPQSLQNKLNIRIENSSLRSLSSTNSLIDFASNDYLGFAKSKLIFDGTHQLLIDRNILQNGATGSRLLSGNHILFEETELFIAEFHQSETALLFNSGYDANVGFFSAVPQRNDIVLYDELCHASIREGIQICLAKAIKFKHNDLDNLEKLLTRYQVNGSEIFIVTESVFSMDGDSPDFINLIQIAEKHNALLVVDEAHALGVIGIDGEGFVQSLNLQDRVFARIMTFGKGLGCHGAAVLGSDSLKQYLINFCRSYIYTTALSPHAVATILIAYKELVNQQSEMHYLSGLSMYFNSLFVSNNKNISAIKSIIIPGNVKVREVANIIQASGFEVKPILSPTVPQGQERLRFCLHSYNSKEEIKQVFGLLSTFV